METGQTAAADRLVSKLLEDADNAKNASLWHVAAKLAGDREMPARRLECLEKALELEFANLPEVLNLEKVRTDYGSLLGQYEELARALATLKLPAPAGFRDKVVRTADRWRALDREQEKAATAAAKVLRGLGERELAWDYLTTPVALRPGESDVWINLADALKRQGERDLADRAVSGGLRARIEQRPGALGPRRQPAAGRQARAGQRAVSANRRGRLAAALCRAEDAGGLVACRQVVSTVAVRVADSGNALRGTERHGGRSPQGDRLQ